MRMEHAFCEECVWADPGNVFGGCEKSAICVSLRTRAISRFLIPKHMEWMGRASVGGAKGVDGADAGR